ncbi:MAG: hypothetical protein ACYTG7_09265 [Planctomycetota bacterium]|jgi:hypothetical protein
MKFTQVSRLFGFIILAWLFVQAPEAGLFAGPPADEEPKAAVWRNKKLARALSSKLSDHVVVYETDWFYIIATRKFEAQIAERVAPSVVDAVVEFCDLFGADPKAPFWQEGEKGRLVYLDTRSALRRYVSILASELPEGTVSNEFVESVKGAQSFYWVQPFPYAVATTDGASFKDINQHIFHLLGHILLTLFKFNHTFPPPWLHEGYGAYVAHRFADGNVLYCTRGLNNCMFGTGVFSGLSAWARSENWAYRLRLEDYREEAGSLAALSGLSLGEFVHTDAALSWSFVTYLIDEHPEAFRNFVVSLKRMPGSMEDWPPDHIVETIFKDSFGSDLQTFALGWEEWAENVDPHVGRRSMDLNGRSAKATIKFDPAVHLAEFESYVSETPRPELAAFQQRAGEWITPTDLASIRKKWAKVRGKISLEVEAPEPVPTMTEREAAAVQKLRPSRKNMLTVRTPPSITSEIYGPISEYYLPVDEMLSWLGPEVPSDLYRAVVAYLVHKNGFQIAYMKILERFDPELFGDENFPLADEIAKLGEAALLEEELFWELVKKGVHIQMKDWPGRAKLLAFEEGMVVCEAKEEITAVPPECPDCMLTPGEGFLEVHCPISRLDFKTFLTLCKNNLKRKGDQDREGYALLLAFRGDEKLFRSEIKRIKGEAKAVDLTGVLERYRSVLLHADLLAMLAGDPIDDPDQKKDRLLDLMQKTKGTALYEVLGRSGRAAAIHILQEYYLEGDRFVRSFNGFRGFDEDTGKATFLLDFEDPTVLESFDFENSLIENHLREKYQTEPPGEVEPFDIQDGKLACYGTDLAVFQPVFSGEIELRGRVRIGIKEGKDPGSFFTLFGYGLNEGGGYVGASCLAYLELQEYIGSGSEPVNIIENLGMVDETRFYDFQLKGTDELITYTFQKKSGKPLVVKGSRTGRVFLWVCGTRMFEFESLEILAGIDPDWFSRALDDAVEKDLELFQ